MSVDFKQLAVAVRNFSLPVAFFVMAQILMFQGKLDAWLWIIASMLAIAGYGAIKKWIADKTGKHGG